MKNRSNQMHKSNGKWCKHSNNQRNFNSIFILPPQFCQLFIPLHCYHFSLSLFCSRITWSIWVCLIVLISSGYLKLTTALAGISSTAWVHHGLSFLIHGSPLHDGKLHLLSIRFQQCPFPTVLADNLNSLLLHFKMLMHWSFWVTTEIH